MIDEKLTASIQKWVNTPSGERDVAVGAALLLKFNRNQWLYRSACLFPAKYEKLVEHELKKHLAIRLAGYTQREVAQMEAQVLPAAEAALADGAPVGSTDTDQPQATYRGKRADHDSLPEAIRAIYEENGAIYYKMKRLFETLKGMAKAEPCDRYEYTAQLRDLHARYCKNWEAYDTYSPAQAAAAAEEAEEAPVPAAEQTVPVDEVTKAARALSAARRWVSEWIRRIPGIEDEAVRAERIEELRSRVQIIISSGSTFKPEIAALISALGVDVPQQ